MTLRYEQLLAAIEQSGVAPGLGKSGQHFGIEQNPVELARFLDICLDVGVQSMLEIGVGASGGLARFAYKRLYWAVTGIDHRVPTHVSGRFILGDSGDEDVYRQVRNERFDLVFIDGDHSDYAVKRDYDLYAPLAKKIVALHDVAPEREGTEGVAQFWREILDTTGLGGIGTIIDPINPIGIGWYGIIQPEKQHE